MNNFWGLRGKESKHKVADAIVHSRKYFKDGSGRYIQADVAISYTLKGSGYHRKAFDDGVNEHIERLKKGITDANPRLFINVDFDREILTIEIQELELNKKWWHRTHTLYHRWVSFSSDA